MAAASARARWNPAHAPVALGRRFYQIAIAHTAEVQEPVGLRPLEFGVLVRLHDSPGLDQNTLAERMALDRTSMSGLVSHLEAMGLVERTVNDADRRARVLRLTAAGRALHQRQAPKAQAAQERMLAVLSPAERRTLIDLLVRVIEANADYVRPGAGRRRPGAAATAGAAAAARRLSRR